MRYLIILFVTFAVYFWAVKNIGDKYVVVEEANLPPEPSQAIVDLNEGKYRMQQLQKPEEGSKVPTVRIVEY